MGQFADFELEFLILPINRRLSALARLSFLHTSLSPVGSLMYLKFHLSI